MLYMCFEYHGDYEFIDIILNSIVYMLHYDIYIYIYIYMYYTDIILYYIILYRAGVRSAVEAPPAGSVAGGL